MAGDAGTEGASSGLSDALRVAVEKTFAATAQPRGRAQDLLGDLSRRGQETRDDLSRRGVEAREASAAAAARLAELVERLRQTKDLEARVATLERQVEKLEKDRERSNPKPEVEG